MSRRSLGGRALVVAMLAVAMLAVSCARPPDLQAYCAVAAPCEGETVEDCVDDARALHAEQRERGCASEGAAVLNCHTQHGRCETVGTWSLYAHTGECDREVQALAQCLDRTR